MRPRWRLFILALALAGLALTARWWAPPLLAFATANSETIQGVEAMLSALLGLGGLAAGILAWRAKSEASLGERIGDQIGHDQNNLEIAENEGVLVQGSHNTINNYFLSYQAAGTAAKLNQTEFTQAMSEYLSWSAEFFDQARLFGMERLGVNDQRPNKSLQEVFIPLTLCRVIPPRRDEMTDFLAEIEPRDGLEKQIAYLKMMEDRRNQSAEVDILDLFRTSSCLAVIGGPGCGKSTLLAFLAVRSAQYILTGSPPPIPLPPGVLSKIPLIVPLRGYAEYRRICGLQPDRSLNDPISGTLVGYILYALSRYGARVEKFKAEILQRLLQSGDCLVMLDGLDEVVDRAIREKTREEIEQLAGAYPKNAYIVTARETGYQEHAILDDRFVRLDVRPLKETQIEELVKNWCKQLYPHDIEGKKAEITNAILAVNARRGDEDLPPLIQTPLMVTMVVGVQWSRTELPRERAKLYDAAIEVVLALQYSLSGTKEEREVLVEWGGKKDEQREWLWTLAYEMHRGGRAAASISAARVREILKEIAAPENLDRFLDAVHQRGGIFEERGEGLFQFAHLTFQEFLAARCIVQRWVGKELIAKYAVDPWWREVLLLVYGFAIYAAPDYARKYLEWLQDLPENARLAGVELAGSAILEIDRPNPAVSARTADRLAAALTDDKLMAESKTRALAGQALARLGDPRPEVMSVAHMQFNFIPPGAFRMGSDERPAHQVFTDGFWIGRYPVTRAQFQAFAAAGGYRVERFWDEARQAGFWSPEGFKGRYDDEPRLAPVNYGAPFDLDNHPAVGVSWFEALAFCAWLGEELAAFSAQLSAEEWERKLLVEYAPPERSRDEERQRFITAARAGSLRVALPGEAEWEKAARGGAGFDFPWGSAFDPLLANTAESGLGCTNAVGAFPRGRSCFGPEEMSGGVWEWTRSLFKEYPYDPSDGRESMADVESPRVLRGGSWLSNARNARCAYRLSYDPNGRNRSAGIRVVVLPSAL